jgi:hypothetical protein
MREGAAHKLSAGYSDHAQLVIEPAELHRAYQRAALAEREATLLRAMVEVLRLDRDAWREQASR